MIPFTKLEALGNDFVVLDGRNHPLDLDRGKVRALGDRRRGIGFDQLLELRASNSEAAFEVHIHNRDGSPAEQCGNGMRALAAWLDLNDALPAAGLRIDTPAGPVHLSRAEPIGAAAAWTAELPGLELEERNSDVGVRNVRLGNPHRVVVIDEAPDADRLAQERRRFADAETLNLGIVHAVDPTTLQLRVHERGAGPTPACGSGACAAAAAMIGMGRAESPVRVEQPGGIVVVDWIPGESRVRLTGPARVVFEGQIAWPTPPKNQEPKTPPKA